MTDEEPLDYDPDVDDEDGDQVVYDIADWNGAQRAELSDQLLQLGIAHGFDEHGDLVVLVDDEDAVDAILDGVEFPDQLDPDHTTDLVGEATIEAVHELFVAADRLVHDPEGSSAVLAAVDAFEAITDRAPPFGVEGALWRDVVSRGRALHTLLTTEQAVLDDDIVEAATDVRTALRPLV